MEKKNLKWYEAPQVEIVEVESAVALLAGSVIDDGSDVPPPPADRD